MSESDWLTVSVNNIMAFQIASGMKILFQVLFTRFQVYLSVREEIITGWKFPLWRNFLGDRFSFLAIRSTVNSGLVYTSPFSRPCEKQLRTRDNLAFETSFFLYVKSSKVKLYFSNFLWKQVKRRENFRHWVLKVEEDITSIWLSKWS